MPNQSKTFTVPQAVRAAAKRGLEARKKHGRGGLDTRQAKKEGVGSGVQRASNLIQGTVTYATVKRMLAFFNRHKAFKEHHSDPSSAAKISWDLWGGSPGFAWAKRIVKEEEQVKKGSLLALHYFGDDYPEDEPEVTVNANSFTALIRKARQVVDPFDFEEEDLIEAEDDEEAEPADHKEIKPPIDAIPAENRPLTDAEIEEAVLEEDDEVEKGVVTIDLMGDEEEEDLPDTDPAPPVPPPLVPQPVPPEPELELIDVGSEVLVSPYDHVNIKKIAKKARKHHSVEAKAKRQGLYICRGQWNQVDLDLVQGYLSYIDDPEMRFNALAVGGEAMLDVIEKAQPKVPAKYLEGLTGEERQKRKREIQRRMKDKDRGPKYGEIPGDDKKTRPSKYSRTSFANKVREEVKKPGKDEFLRAAAKVSGIPKRILAEVHERGAEAWATSGRRPGASQAAWSRARVYSFCTGGKTRRTADADLWRKYKESK
jgi:hypothetical protein